MMKRHITVLCMALIFAFMSVPASAQTPAEKFYRGKTVRFVVGFGAGGGYDVLTRAVARYIDKHIPGKPAVIVENMPGAGSLIVANFLYDKAKPDGLTAGVFSSGLVTQQAMDSQRVRFDARSSSGWAR